MKTAGGRSGRGAEEAAGSGAFGYFYDRLIEETGKYYARICDSEEEKRIWEICEEKQLKEYFARVSLRTLISEIAFFKEKRLLKGNSPEQEYWDYINTYLQEESYIRGLFRRYPVMEEEIRRGIRYFAENLKRFAGHLKQDLDKIRGMAPSPSIGGYVLRRVVPLSSDYHFHHRSVMEAEFQNGVKVIYKPRSLRSEALFYEVYAAFCRANGLESCGIRMAGGEDHGWMEFAEQRECRNEEEVKEYYYRYGVMLFTAYVLGSADLHYENIIADGSRPVLVDLEVLTALSRRREETGASAGDIIRRKLKRSVCQSGMLPLFAWDRNGKGINVSAINGKGGQLLPIKIPVVKYAGTSNICIDYAFATSPQGKNLVRCQGRAMDPLDYVDQIEAGFMDAGSVLMRERGRIKEMVCKKMEQIAVRFLARNTQEYSMMLSLSYHPSFLSSKEERESLLRRMLGEKEGEKEAWIAASETESMKVGDIPYFYAKGCGTALYNDAGQACADFFERTPRDLVLKSIEEIQEKDIEFETDLIRFSMKQCRDGEEGRRPENLSPDAYLEKTAEAIKRQAIYSIDGEDVNWITSVNASYGERKISLDAMDDYLYAGRMGVLLFLKAYLRERRDEEALRISNILETRLFRETEKKAGAEYAKLRPTGAFTGEASIVYGYQAIYCISGQEIWLQYAKRHAEYLERLLEKDKEHDLTGGNAGAIAVLVNLYRLSGWKIYLKAAEKAFECLKTAVCEYGDGGAAVSNSFAGRPLTGVAHGCSGYILALSRLAFYSQNPSLYPWIKKFMDYEESLWDQGKKDWKDLRYEEEAKAPELAWCHGKAGILSVYQEILPCCGQEMKTAVLRTLERREWLKKVFRVKEEDGLCHGNMGIYAMFPELSREAGGNPQNPWNICYPQRSAPLGFMTGITGVGYYLLKEKYGLPDILKLDIQMPEK